MSTAFTSATLGQERPRVPPVLFVRPLALFSILLAAPCFADERTAQHASRWEQCIKTTYAQHADTSSKDKALHRAKEKCEALQDATLSGLNEEQKSKVAAQMEAAMEAYFSG